MGTWVKFKELKKHIGHNIVCQGFYFSHTAAILRLGDYGMVELYCKDCKETLVRFKKGGE